MTDVWFYHLERANLEGILPGLLEKTLERGWRALIVAGSDERAEMIDSFLWTFRDESFLPHGRTGEMQSPDHPVLIGTELSVQNGANLVFFVDGARPNDWQSPDITERDRCIFVFDGNLDAAVAAAREDWSKAKAAGHEVTYWQQSAGGKWEQKA